MFHNRYVILVLIALFGSGIAFWYKLNKPILPVPQIDEYIDQSNAHISALKDAHEAQNLNKNTPEFKEKLLKKAEKYLKLDGSQLAPVAFYGQVVDQYGAPVEAAEVDYQAAGGAFFSGTGSGSIMTDSNGMFDLLAAGVKGTSVSFNYIKKIGYEFNRAEKGSAINAYHFESYKRFYDSMLWTDTSPDVPYRFVMWKIEQRANIIQGKKRYYFSSDGRNLSLDGTNHYINLNDRVSRNHIEPEKKHFGAAFTRTESNWELVLVSKNGGFVEILPNEIYLNEPPLDGYREMIALEGIKDIPRSNIYQRRYYLKTETNQYASLSLEIRPFHNKNSAALSIEYALNTDGTPHLATESR